MPIEKNNLDKNTGDNENSDEEGEKKTDLKEEPESNLKGEDIKTINAFQAHKDSIKAIQYIHSTDVPLIFTAGLDRMAYIHDFDKKLRGKFLQGYKTKPQKWEFPLVHHDSTHNNRKREVEKALEELRKDRNQDKAYKKKLEQAEKKYGHMRSSLGFAGAAMMGMTAEFSSNGVHTKPSNFQMSKQTNNSQSLSTTIYDDTGRGAQAMKVARLLDRAKQVMAHENKKAQREMKRMTNQTQGRSKFNMSGTSNNFKSGANSTMQNQGGFGGYNKDMDEDDEEDEEKEKARKIGPFTFDIDDDIDTEVLTNE